MNDSENNKFITYDDEMISDYIENGMIEEEAVKNKNYLRNGPP